MRNRQGLRARVDQVDRRGHQDESIEGTRNTPVGDMEGHFKMLQAYMAYKKTYKTRLMLTELRVATFD